MAIALTGNDKFDIEAGVYTPLKFDSEKRSKRNVLHHLLGFVLAAVGLYTLTTNTAAQNVIPSIFAVFAPAPVVLPVEVFEIAPPLTVPASAYVSSYLLFNDSAVVDGLKTKYVAPKVFNFTQGFLTLNFSVPASAAPVSAPVVELSVDGTPVWRSSTPYAKVDADVYTSTTKNVTELLSLFESSSKVVFSVLEEGDAPVSASLELVLFNDTSAAPAKRAGTVAVASYFASEGPASLAAASYFASEGPASLVVPLQKKAIELPASEFSVSLPQLNSNVTSAKISLFASASKDEVEFYKNDIAALGVPVTANGPVRQLNVFVAGVYVGTVSPKPTLFHADKLTTDAGKLWSPLADSGSFTGFTYDIDLVAVLPLLWEGPQTLDIALVSPVDAANGPVPAVAHPVSATTNLLAGSWFVSGSLLAWENPLVSFSVGEVVLTNSSQLDSGVSIAPPAVSPWQPKLSNTIVRSTIKSTIESLFNFTLIDNTTASYAVVANSSAALVLTKQRKESKIPVGPPGGPEKTEDTTSAFYIGTNKFKLDVQDPLTNLTLYSKSVKSAYPLTISDSIKNSPITGPSSSFSAKIGIDIKTKINAAAGPKLKIDELVKLDDITGATTDVKVMISEPGSLPFSREVEVVNGTIVKDLSFPLVKTDEFTLVGELVGYF
ncbi:CIC11C00000000626 [Sungouiella intermedia]|uniref:CIC11C00000000626 n=1 Tax=Sungouiella intermedia TaxID=45354 RepID=A0A1L0DN69_9ASCO|nr:CIC11C00000000626 [[Candida] intermedia]